MPRPICYATGEIACVGDRVDDDGWAATVEDVISSAEDMARWGLHEPGLMLKSDAAGLDFAPCSSIAWDAIVLEGRKV